MDKVLVLCRDFNHLGGVVNYIKSTIMKISNEKICVKIFTIGRRSRSSSNFYYLMVTIFDPIIIFFKLFNNDYKLVHINPSLGIIPLIRDSLFILLAKLHSKKILVFFHGWNESTENYINKSNVLIIIFRNIYDLADATIVLSSRFRDKLKVWGFKQPIFLETTSFDEELINGFCIHEKIKHLKGDEKLTILFLSRIQKEKGVIETIEAFSALKDNEREFELIIAGDGPFFDEVKKSVQNLGDSRIKMVGYLDGPAKRKVLTESHLMCLPTKHGEGLPVSILEAMAFGVVVVTTPVGGIPDVFKNGENGYFLRSTEKEEFSCLLRTIISNKEGMAQISKNNWKTTSRKFSSTAVSHRIEELYGRIIKC